MLLVCAADAPDALLARLHSRREGLAPREAAARLARHGPNEIAREAPPAPLHRLWLCLRSPFSLLLGVLAAIALIGRDFDAAAVIGAIVALATAIRFVQEGRSHRAAERLQALVGHRVGVRRDGHAREIAREALVPGDIVLLSAGTMVPADARLLDATGLHVAQSTMTGESMPVAKDPEVSRGDDPLAAPSLLFMGTSVVSGSGTAVVVATGAGTWLGALAGRLVAAEDDAGRLQHGLDGLAAGLLRFVAVIVPLVFVVNGWTKGDWLQALLFALSVAVGLTPEMLPMIVTTTLARGAIRLARRKVVVKRLDAIQGLGAIDVLCTDKTGTLTQDRVAVARHLDPWGHPCEAVLRAAWLNSAHQTGLVNLLDRAVLDEAHARGIDRSAPPSVKLGEVPFDFERRRISVLVAPPDGPPQLVCKGAIEEVIALCTRVRGPAQPGVPAADLPLDAARLAEVRQVMQAINDDGLRLVAVATRPMPGPLRRLAAADECGLTLQGAIAFVDPPRESSAPALAALAAHGVTVKVLTGDNAVVAARLVRQVGLAPGEPMLGAQVDALDDRALGEAVAGRTLFAKLTPLHKERIVRALRAAGHRVGYLGDGINDAAALRAADVGLSVSGAVDIAKEAADVILLEKSLAVLDEGVVEGRATFCNLLKYLRATTSSNLGNALSVVVASVVLPFLPMRPLQLLVQNLLYDIAQASLPFDRVDPEQLARPVVFDAAGIGRFMLWFGPLSSLFDLATFALMWFVFGADAPARQALFQSGWFVVGLLTQTLVVHVLRTARLPFFGSRAAMPLAVASAAVAAIGLALPGSPLAPAFGFVPLPAPYFGWLAGGLVAYFTLAALLKRAYARRHGWQ